MERTLPTNLEDAVLLLENAAIIRERRKADPTSEPDETTEDDVITAMSLEQISHIEIVDAKDMYTRTLRRIIKSRALTNRGK